MAARRTCQGVGRREFMQIGGSTVLGLTLADLLALHANQTGYQVGSARAVIFLWLWGGPSQLDTWDPKPNAAPMEYRGPYSPIATRTNGVRICELFPRISEWTDRIAIIRSLHTTSNDHGVAGTVGLTGSMQGSVNLGGAAAAGSVRPCVGSIVARAKGFRSALPPFMVVGGRLHQGKRAITGEGGGTLGALYDPFRLVFDPDRGTQIPALATPPTSLPTVSAIVSNSCNRWTWHAVASTPAISRTIDDYRAPRPSRLLTSPDATRMFDVTQERPRIGRPLWPNMALWTVVSVGKRPAGRAWRAVRAG